MVDGLLFRKMDLVYKIRLSDNLAESLGRRV